MRAGCGRSEAAVFHGLGQFLVFQKLSGAFHGGQKRRFGVAGRRFRGFLLKIGLQNLCLLLRRRKRRNRIFVARGFLVHVQPARHPQNLALGAEHVGADRRNSHGHVVLRLRIECRYEAARYHVVNFAFVGIELLVVRFGRNYGEVVADLLVVEYAPAGLGDVFFVDGPLREFCVRLLQRGQRLCDDAPVVLRERAAVGARIGYELVFFVERLGYAQRPARAVSELVVGLALKCGQVVQAGSRLFGKRVFVAHLGDSYLPYVPQDGLGVGMLPYPVRLVQGRLFRRLEVRTLINALVLSVLHAEARRYAPIGSGFEILYFVLALDYHRKRRRLHPADGRQILVAHSEHSAGYRAGRVDSDKPVGFAPATRGVL